MKFIIVALLFLSVSAVDVKCTQTIRDPTKQRVYEFDLSSLHHDDSTYVDTLWYRTDNNTIYYMNFCGQTASACDDTDTSVCIRVPDGGDYKYVNGGKTTSQKITEAEASGQSYQSSVTVTYTTDRKCGSDYFKTKVYVNCQPTATPGYFYDIDESNECMPILYMWAAAGCGKEMPGPYPYSSDSSFSSSSSNQCGGTILDEKNHRAYNFDLSRLHHDDTTYVDTLWYRTKNNTIYYVNFCGQTAAGCKEGDTSVCIRESKSSDFTFISGGKTSTQTITKAEAPGQSIDTSVTVTYSDGAKCSSGQKKTKLYVNCQETAEPGFFYDIDETNDCEATLYMWSAAGCGKEVPYPSF